MTLYNLYCDRCDQMTTHEEVWNEPENLEESLAIKHPQHDTIVLCRDCDRGTSKADIPEKGLDVSVTISLKVREIDVTLDPSEIRDGESVSEYAERVVTENHMEELKDSITAQVVEDAYIEREDGVWPQKE